ncbi:MAG: helix-turn-helix domain-containing protein [Acidimicrobiia bacterium]
MPKAEPSSFVWHARTARAPRTTLDIDDPEAIKVFWDPLRQEILKALTEPASVNDLAERLEQPAHRLYYHLRLLEQHGFVVPVESRRVGSNTEVLYGLTANRFTSRLEGDALAAFGSQPQRAFASAARQFDAAMTDPDVRDRKDGFVATATTDLILTPAQARALRDRLSALVDEYAEKSVRRRGARPMVMFHALFPKVDATR